MRLFLDKKYSGKPAAFLDRDGTINQNRRGEYIVESKQFKLYKCTIKALQLLTQKGYQIVVLSNHSGIGRGYMTQNTAEKINKKMSDMLISAGIALSGIYICPHKPEASCTCRKPKDGLLKEAISDLNINLRHSFVAGDSAGDIKLAYGVNLPSFLVLTGAGLHTSKKFPEANKFGTLLSLAKAIPQI